MKFCGIICEFNPFHNGHEYLIKEAKKITGEGIVCLMSGNFVQRGEPAIQEKYERAKQAIMAGADAVLELPTIYACSNAENFAFGAIKTLTALGVKYLAFGVENAELETLQKIAKIKFENSEAFVSSFKNEIENGICYNTALKRAIAKEFDDNIEIEELLKKPNNILAIEYLTVMLKLNSMLTPIAINRVDNGYYSNKENKQFLSASGIRKLIFENNPYENFIPKFVNFDKYFNEICKLKFENLIIWNLRKLTPQTLEKLYDYSEGIEYRVKEKANLHSTLDEIIDNISTPRYRLPRVKKLVLYPTLEITKQAEQQAKTTKAVAKVLAVSKTSKDILSYANKRKINLISTNKDYQTLSKQQKLIIGIDLNASNIYNTVAGNQNNNDYKKGTLFV